MVQQDPDQITADLLASLPPKDLRVIDRFRQNWEREKPYLSHPESSNQIAQTLMQHKHHHSHAVAREQNEGQYAQEIAQWNKWTPPILKTLVGAGDEPTRKARSEYLETQVNRQRYETLIEQDTKRLTVAQQEEQALERYQNDGRTPLANRLSDLLQTTPELADKLAQTNTVLDTLASTQHDAERLGLSPEIVRPFQEAAVAYSETGEINNAETLKGAMEVVKQANAMEQAASEQMALG